MSTRTKPFNLEAALRGEKVVTRDGREVTQLHRFDCADPFCLIGVLGTVTIGWKKDGIYIDKEQKHPNDLFLLDEPKKVTLYGAAIVSRDTGIVIAAILTEDESERDAEARKGRYVTFEHEIEVPA